MSFTHLNNNGFKNSNHAKSWNGMCLSDATVAHRNQLKHGMDDFTSFTWRGVDAWDTFGAFIINKDSLKFYNGPSFSNEYTKPQFESAAGQLTGVTFQIQKIDFTIGVYWINEQDYRQLIHWLNPYEINTLTFGFEDNYFYQVKLAAIENGIRHIVGKEYRINYETETADVTSVDSTKYTKWIGTTDPKNHQYRKNHVYYNNKDIGYAIDSEYEYYTELKLTFEIQGPACAYNKLEYNFDNYEDSGTDWPFHPEKEQGYAIKCLKYSENNLMGASDLETPIKIIYDLDTTVLYNILEEDKEYLLSLEAYAQYNTSDTGDTTENWEENTLFSISLDHISFLINDPEYIINGHLVLEYDSESGLLFLLNGTEYNLLNTLTTSSQGRKILNHMIVNKYAIAGKLNYYIFDPTQLQFTTYCRITAKTNNSADSNIPTPSEIFGNCQIIARGRTNLI